MVAFKTFTGVCQQGPLSGKVQTAQSNRLPATGGFYVFVKSSGATPGAWRWIENEKGITK